MCFNLYIWYKSTSFNYLLGLSDEEIKSELKNTNIHLIFHYPDPNRFSKAITIKNSLHIYINEQGKADKIRFSTIER